MVSVVKRPTGHKLIDQAITATIIESYEGDALVTFPYHALTTGDTVYITSDIEEYNGFWYVTVVTADSFKISEYEDAAFVEFYQEVDIEYYQTQSHDWSSIFLPIVYKLTTDKWPTNNLNTSRTVSSATDDNGFTNLVLSGALIGSINALEFVKISGGAEEINGVWQVVEVISTSNVVISLPYDSANSFSGVTVQYYYNNYQAKVKIYAGLPADHPWQAKKPYTEVAELSLTPDENNEVMFSISDYISSDVKVRNNLTLYSLPLNLDAFTGFYISTSETYDQSDNYSLYTEETFFIPDTFEGYAIAGKLPFKNIYSGDYADYVYTSGSPARWLTVQERPLMVVGYFFDLSFIKNTIGNFNAVITKYIADYATTTETVAYTDMGVGVYRIPITPDANYDSFCLQIIVDAHSEEVEETLTEDFDLSLWTNGNEGLTDWTTGIANPFVNIVGTNSEFLLFPYATIAGQTYSYEYEFFADNTGVGTKTYQLLFLDAAFLAVGFSFIDIPGDGTHSGAVNITPSSNGTYIAVKVSSIAVPMDITAIRVSLVYTVSETVEVPATVVTEEICMDILDACDVSDGFTPSGIRLLEDGGYRLLE